MRAVIHVLGALLPMALLIVGCGERPNPIEPAGAAGAPTSSLVGGSSMAIAAGGRRLLMLDQCDPDSFNAAIEPGTCINRNGGLTFDTFLALLQKQQAVPSWRFSPAFIHVPTDLTLPIVNAGGEVHTFTEVESFGGGIVPVLNNLSGNAVPAPECLALSPSDFIAPGGQATHTFEPGKGEKYQCCIHPWMRASTR